MTEATKTPPAVGAFCWFELNSPDPKAAIEFFNAVFGWTAMEFPMDGFTYNVLQKGGQSFGGVIDSSGPQWEGVPPHWMNYLRVEDVDASAAQVTELGGTVCVPPTDIAVGRFSVVSDPTGGTFSLFKAKDGPEAIGDAIIWTELMTTDTKAATDFYTSMFKWTTESMDMGEGMNYTMWKEGENNFGGMMQMEGPQFEGVPPHWLNYIGVDDVKAYAAKAEAHGANIVCPPMELPKGSGHICVFADPTGAHIALYQPGANSGADCQ